MSPLGEGGGGGGGVKKLSVCVSKKVHIYRLSLFKLPFVIKIFVWSIFEWPLYTGFTVSRWQIYHLMYHKRIVFI